MAVYSRELWIGRIWGGGYHWEIRGVPDDSYEERASICNEMAKKLRELGEYYQHLAYNRQKNLTRAE